MQSQTVEFTSKAQTLIGQLSSDSQLHVKDYLDNAIVRDALASGEVRRFYVPINGNNKNKWMVMTCTQDAKIDLQFLQANYTGLAQPMNPREVDVASMLPHKPRTMRSLEFHRASAFVDQMVHAMREMKYLNDTTLFEDAAQTLAHYIPRADQALRLAQRLHRSDRAPREFMLALNRSGFFGDYVDDSQEIRVAPISTVRTLLQVHAGVHLSEQAHEITPQSALYALHTPSGRTTYLFIKPRTPSKSRQETSHAGVHMWMDGDGTPLVLGREFDGETSWWSDDPAKPHLLWASIKHSQRAKDCTLAEHHKLYFNDTTAQYCADLAAATPRQLSPAQTRDVVQKWVDSGPTMQDLWKKKNISETDYGMQLFLNGKIFEDAITSWGQWMVKSWAEARDQEHSVLETLLGGVGGIGSIEEWRQAMRRMSPTASPAETIQIPESLIQEPTPCPK